MNYFAMAALAATISFSVDGCTPSSSIFPQERVVVDADKTDFGFVGSWRSVPQGDNAKEDVSDDIAISMAADGVYTLESNSLVDYKITLRATELTKDSGYAIVDLDIVAHEKLYCRYLLLAKRKDEELFVWWIQSKNIAKLLHESGHSGVVEHGTFTTRVHAKPDALLDCVRKHSNAMVGEPTRLKLVGK